MIEVGEIFRLHGLIYRQHARFMPPSHGRVMGDIVHGRTEFFGGHVHACDTCDKKRYTYHSCANRHCPKCQGKATKRWIEARQKQITNAENQDECESHEPAEDTPLKCPFCQEGQLLFERRLPRQQRGPPWY